MARRPAFAFVALALALAATAHAGVLEDDRPIDRRGFVLGVHGGWGVLASERCDGCGADVGGFFGAQLGGMIGRRLALLGGLEWGGRGGHVVLSFHGGARYFATPRWWAEGSIGGTTLSLDEGDGVDSRWNGVAGRLAGGLDLFQGAAFAFDASVRAMVVRSELVGGDRDRHDVVLSFQLGATWY